MEPLEALGTQIRFATDGRQYLTFALGGQEYGIDILNVQEIKGYSPITPIPNSLPSIIAIEPIPLVPPWTSIVSPSRA